MPALDGLRGVAVAAVMFCHTVFHCVPQNRFDKAILDVLGSGWLGVDIFFVLSGFLITGILLDTRDNERYFRNFYVRRTLRIFPLYYCIVLVTFTALRLAPSLKSLPTVEITAHPLWFWLYACNVAMALKEAWAPLGALGHFWSLAVEEQFYLIWPAVVFACRPRTLMRVCLATMVVSLALRAGLLAEGARLSALVLMPARADQLAAGALLALLLRSGLGVDRVRSWARIAFAVAGGVLAVLYLLDPPLKDMTPYMETVGFSLLAIATAGAIGVAHDTADGPSRLGRLLAWAPLRFLGKYSYAMYALHVFVLTWLRSWGLDSRVASTLTKHSALPGMFAYISLVFATTIVLAMLSWNLLESRFLALKDRFAPQHDAADPLKSPALPVRARLGTEPLR